MYTKAETVNAARDLAYNNNRTVYVYFQKPPKGWTTTFIESVAGDKHTKCYPNGKTEEVEK